MLFAHYQDLAKRYVLRGPCLEIGAAAGHKALLSAPCFADFERVAINLSQQTHVDGIRFERGNSNDMRALFGDGQFGTVLSNAVLEHDRYFWRSVDEMKRVLASGGLLMVGAPGFIPLSQTAATIGGFDAQDKATITYNVHAKPDYWRFSRQAFLDVIFEGLELLELKVVGRVPRLVGVGRKKV